MEKGTWAWAYNGVKIASSINSVKRIGLVHPKMKLDHQIILHTWINSKWIKDLNISYDTIKVLTENIESKITDIPHNNIFVAISPTASEIKEKINKWDYIKLKRFCMARGTITKTKKEPTVWVNIFADDTLNKGLISKIYKEVIWLNTRKTNNQIKKWAKDLNRHFSKGDIQRAQRHMKGCSASLAIGDTN